MTLEQLRIFVAVAEREHLTQGARALNLTQSAVSSAVATLEARYATRLFDRIGRRIVLTEAGRLFLVEARAVLARAAAAETVLSDLSGLARGSLALTASQTVANYWLPPLIQRFRQDHPGITVSLAIANTETVSAAIRDGEADLGFIEGEVDDPALAMTAVAEDELVIVVPAGHGWARARPPASELRRGAWPRPRLGGPRDRTRAAVQRGDLRSCRRRCGRDGDLPARGGERHRGRAPRDRRPAPAEAPLSRPQTQGTLSREGGRSLPGLGKQRRALTSASHGTAMGRRWDG